MRCVLGAWDMEGLWRVSRIVGCWVQVALGLGLLHWTYRWCEGVGGVGVRLLLCSVLNSAKKRLAQNHLAAHGRCVAAVSSCVKL